MSANLGKLGFDFKDNWSGSALPYFYGFKILPNSSLSFEKALLSDANIFNVEDFDKYFISTLNLDYSLNNGDLILSQGV